MISVSPTFRVWFLLALTPWVPWLGILPWGRWWMPLLVPLTVLIAFQNRVRLGDYFGAWRLGMVWAVLLSLGVIGMVYARPDATARAILHGEAHRQEMFHWIATGEGGEGRPAAFLPRQLLQLTAFVGLTWVSGGYLGLALAALLVGCMSYFVGAYAMASGSLWVGPAMAWYPWAVLRLLTFLLLGVLFSRPFLVRRPWPFGPRERVLLALAASGVVVGVLIQTFLAPQYGLALRQLAGGLIR